MLMFSLPDFVWLQNRFGGGLQTGCPAGMWKATALVLFAVNACLHPLESLLVESIFGVVRSVVSEPFRFALSCLQLMSSLVCSEVSCCSFLLSLPF